jgi:hypothetical protein
VGIVWGIRLEGVGVNDLEGAVDDGGGDPVAVAILHLAGADSALRRGEQVKGTVEQRGIEVGGKPMRRLQRARSMVPGGPSLTAMRRSRARSERYGSTEDRG